MKQESLAEARRLLIDVIANSEIEQIDKLELLKNLYNFLNDLDYDNNIKILQKELELRKQNGSYSKRI